MELIAQVLGIVVTLGVIVGWVVWLTSKLTRHDAKIQEFEHDLFQYKEEVESIKKELKEFRMDTIRLLTETKTIVDRIEKTLKP